MSLSKPFFNTKSGGTRRQSVDGMTDEQYKQLHWSEQLRLRPLRNRRRYVNDWPVDYDNRLDNFDVDNEREESDVT